MIKRLLGAIFGVLAGSGLKPHSTAEQIKYDQINPFRNGRYSFGGRTNGGSRKRKCNRLHLSKATRNKHR